MSGPTDIDCREISRLTGVEADICKTYLAAVRSRAWLGDGLEWPYQYGENWVVPFRLGCYLCELTQARQHPRISAMHQTGAQCWSLVVLGRDESWPAEVERQGIYGATKLELGDVLRSLLSPIFSARRGSRGNAPERLAQRGTLLVTATQYGSGSPLRLQ